MGGYCGEVGREQYLDDVVEETVFPFRPDEGMCAPADDGFDKKASFVDMFLYYTILAGTDTVFLAAGPAPQQSINDFQAVHFCALLRSTRHNKFKLE